MLCVSNNKSQPCWVVLLGNTELLFDLVGAHALAEVQSQLVQKRMPLTLRAVCAKLQNHLGCLPVRIYRAREHRIQVALEAGQTDSGLNASIMVFVVSIRLWKEIKESQLPEFLVTHLAQWIHSMSSGIGTPS